MGAVRADEKIENKKRGKTLQNKGFQEPPSFQVANKKLGPNKKRKW